MSCGDTRSPNIWMTKMHKQDFHKHKDRLRDIYLRKKKFGYSDLSN